MVHFAMKRSHLVKLLTQWCCLPSLIRRHWRGSTVCSRRRTQISPQFFYDRQPPRPPTAPSHPTATTNGTSPSPLLPRHWSPSRLLSPSSPIKDSESGPRAGNTLQLQAFLLGSVLWGCAATGLTHRETEKSSLHDYSPGLIPSTCRADWNSSSLCCYSTWTN